MFLSAAQKERMEGVMTATYGRRGFDRLALARPPIGCTSICSSVPYPNNPERTGGEAISLAAGVWRRFGEGGGDYSRTYTRTRKLVSETEPNKLPVRAAARFRKPDEEIVCTRLKRKQVS